MIRAALLFNLRLDKVFIIVLVGGYIYIYVYLNIVNKILGLKIKF